MLSKLFFSYFFLFMFAVNYTSAQADLVPKENGRMPTFELSDVDYYLKEKFSNTDLLGRWTIMDFWTKHCVSCITSFPRLNKLREEFKNDVQFILIAQNDVGSNKNIRDDYEKYRKRMSLDFAIAYDSVLTKQFGVIGFPYTIIIDTQGIVYAVTSSESLTPSKLKDLIENRNPTFKKYYSSYELDFMGGIPIWEYYIDEEKPLPKNIIFRSVLSKYNGELAGLGLPRIEDAKERGIYQCTKHNLYQLYNNAYFGKSYWNIYDTSFYENYWMIPDLEIRDTSLFDFDFGDDTGFYNYSLLLQGKNTDVNSLKQIMQRDLFNCFGYKVSIESRRFPYWRLTVTEEARKTLLAKRNKTLCKPGLTSFIGKNISIKKHLLPHIAYYNTKLKKPMPFIDETHINGNIDLELNAVISNLDDVRDKLKKKGLNLEIGEKEMKVLVVREQSR